MRTKKNGTLPATALAIAIAVVALPTVANAQHRHVHSNGVRHFGGVIGAPNYGDYGP